MPITYPLIAEIAKNVYCINEFGMDAMFLFVGTERALLIDTGTCLFDIPATVRQLTDKPVDVALTHGHVDHAGGIGWFEKIYMHPADIEAARTLRPEARRGYAEMLLKLAGGLYGKTADDVVVFDKTPEFVPIREGYVFDLGGRIITVYETPGHTPGGLSFLDADARILITGDACNPNTLLSGKRPDGTRQPNSSVDTLRKTALRIRSLQPFYDRNYNGHIGYGPSISFLPMPDSITDDMIVLCEKILKGEAEQKPETGFNGACVRSVYGAAQVQYDPDYLYED